MMTTHRVALVLIATLLNGATSFSFTSEDLCQLLAPGAPEFGQVVYQRVNDSTEVVLVAKFSCLSGYTLSGSANISCNVDSRWNGSAPICQLNVFDKIVDDCDLKTWNNCLCVNDARNARLWDTERVDNSTKKIVAYPLNVTVLRCQSGDRLCAKDDATKDSLNSMKRRRSAARSRRALPYSYRFARISLNLPSTTNALAHVMTSFEVGPFTRAPANNYIHFYVRTFGGGVHYAFLVTAHCLPDPPGHLVPLGANGYDHFRVANAASLPVGRRDVCLNLKNTARCSARFSVRFSVNVVVDASAKSPQIDVVPIATSATLSSSCRKQKADNE